MAVTVKTLETEGKRVFVPYKKQGKKVIAWRGYIRLIENKKRILSKTFTAKTQLEIHDKLNRYVASGDWERKLYPERFVAIEKPEDVTVGTHFKSWFEAKSKRWGTGTIQNRKYNFDRYLSFDGLFEIQPFLKLKLIDVNEADVIAYFRSLPATTSENTKFEIHKHVKAAFKRAVDTKLILENPAKFSSADDNFQESESDVVAFSPEDQHKLLRYCALTNHPLRAIVQLAFDSGCRIGELLAFSKASINMQAGTIFVSQAVKPDNGKPVLGPPKSKASRRTIKLSKSTLDVLKPLYEALSSPDALLFPNELGGLLDSKNLAKRWKKLLVEAKVENLSIHSCRHSMCKRMIEARIPMPIISGRLGHSKVSISWDIYSKFCSDEQSAIADAMDALFALTVEA